MQAAREAKSRVAQRPKINDNLVSELENSRRVEVELRLLLDITQAVNDAADSETAIQVALIKICQTAGWDIGEAWVPSTDGNTLECSSVWFGRRRRFCKFRKFSERLKFQKGQGLVGTVWARKKATWIRDISVKSRFSRSEIAVQSGLRSAFGVPVLAKSELAAVMVFLVSTVRQQDERFVETIASIGTQIGTYLLRKRIEEALFKRERQLSEAQRLANIGSWEWDLNTNRVQWSKQLYRIFGESRKDFRPSLENYLNRLHSNDRKRVETAIRKARREKGRFENGNGDHAASR